MERFVTEPVVAKVIAEQRAAAQEPETRRRFTAGDADFIKQVTMDARYHGIAAAARRHKVAHSTVRNWYDHAKSNNFTAYFVPAKRGRECLLDEEAEKELVDAVDKIRDRGEAVLSSTVTSIARGHEERRGNSLLLAEHGGVNKYGRSWARAVMVKHQFGVYGKTTDRTIPASHVVKEGPPYYGNIRATGVKPRNLYNMDEFLVLLNGTNHKWTWHRSSCRKTVPLRELKLGFTCSVTTSMDGEVHNLQMIWKGKTNRVHAAMKEEDLNAKITQHHQPNSHFQSAETFKE
jgi:hypothetical protein